MEHEDNKTEPTTYHGDKSEIEYSYRGLADIFIPYLRKLWIVRRRLFFVNTSVVILSVIYVLLFVSPYFESTITILPDYGTQSSGLAALGGLASLAGVSIGQNASPTTIYEELLTCESVIEPVLYADYHTDKFKDSVNLFEFFGIEPDDKLPGPIRKRKMFIDLFQLMTKSSVFRKSIVTTKLDASTNILQFTVRMPESRLSSEVADKLAESLDLYIRTKTKTNAILQREYIEKRVAEVKDSLRVAEDKLMKFQQVNRVIAQSPELTIEQSRLALKVQILDGVYSTLSTQLELAKIQEIKDSPIINVEEWAKDPVVKAGPKRSLIVIFILLLSLIVTISYFLFFNGIRDYFHKLVAVEPTNNTKPPAEGQSNAP